MNQLSRSKPHETREGLRALRDVLELSGLAQEYPHGLLDRDSNDRVLREVVCAMHRGLAAAGLSLRLRLEPFAADPKAGVLSPNRLSVFDGDCRWGIAIQTMENAIFIADRLVVTRGDNVVQHVAETLLHQIEQALGLGEGESE